MRHSRITLLLLSVVALVAASCAQKSPQERVADLRAKYTATVNQSGFAAKARVPEPVMDEAMVDETEPGDEPSDEERFEPPDMEPLHYDILLDVVVATTSRETLPELTIDVVHLDSAKREKERWQVTLDTSRVVRGPGVQITHTLEDIDYVEGDVFFAEVRQPVPPDEVANYPELANAQ